MDYKKRELNKMCKAYDSIYDVNENYLQVKVTKELILEIFEQFFTKEGYELKLTSNDTWILKKKEEK